MQAKEIIDEVREEVSELFIPDHCTHESMATISERLVDRAEGIVRQYPWVVLTMAAGLGYLASRRLT